MAKQIEKTEVAAETFVTDGTKAADYIAKFGNVSKAIRGLAADPYFQKDGKVNMGLISKALDKRFQHVRNVLITPVKKA